MCITGKIGFVAQQPIENNLLRVQKSVLFQRSNGIIIARYSLLLYHIHSSKASFPIKQYYSH